MTKITLCSIVRDEEAMLPACLASVRGAVDRIVIVDTGSRDRTPVIAREHGALVVDHVWQDDFAAARNAALAHVDGGFVLVLDADERLADGAASALRSAASRGDVDCGLLALHDAVTVDAEPAHVLSGQARRGEPVLVPRFVRRTDDLAWDGIVHESLNLWVARGKRRVRRVEAAIVHYGAVPEVRRERDKDARNFRLLERRVALAPDDPIARTYLARELERRGDPVSAAREVHRAWADLRRARDAGAPLDAVATATLHAFLCLRSGDLEQAAEVLDYARRADPGHPNLALLSGVLHEQSAHVSRSERDLDLELAQAEAEYRECLAHRGDIHSAEVLPGATDWAALTRMGTVLLVQGRAGEARDCFERALARRPGHVEAVLGRLEAEVRDGDARRALGEIAALAGDPAPDAWILAALACVRLGLAEDAAGFALEARRRIATSAPAGAHRRALLSEVLSFCSGESGPSRTRESVPG